jgi:hypothetical protein
MTSKECNYFEGCSAPICPMEPDETNGHYPWYPDEEICRKRKDVPVWIKQQRKIAKKAKPDNHGFYFLLDMLRIPFRVTSSVKGLNPDQYLKDEPRQLKAWLKTHKGAKKRKPSGKLKDTMAKVRAAKTKTKHESTIIGGLVCQS